MEFIHPIQKVPVVLIADIPRQALWNKGRRDITALEASCLLYTSDAADERSSVDLGGRRIIKKKKNTQIKTKKKKNKKHNTTGKQDHY